MSERGEPPSPRKYSGAVYCAVPRMSSRSASGAASTTPGDFGRAEIDDLRRSGLVDHDVVGPQVLVQHLLAVKGAQALGDLLDDAAHRFQVRPWIVDHPLRQRLSVDEFRRDVEVVALSRVQAGLQYVRTVDAPGDPFFHHEALQIGGVVAQVDRRDLDRDQRVGVGIDRQINVASAAGVQFPDDSVPSNSILASSSGGSGNSDGCPKTSLLRRPAIRSIRTIWIVRLSGLPCRKASSTMIFAAPVEIARDCR